MKLPPLIRDDRGRGWRFREDSLRDAMKGEVIDPPAPADVCRRLKNARALGVLVLFLGLAAMMIGDRFVFEDVSGVMSESVLVVAYGVVVVLAFLANRLINANAQKDAARCLGRCASCLSGLGGVEPAEDGCRECPRCGTAWRLELARQDGEA